MDDRGGVDDGADGDEASAVALYLATAWAVLLRGRISRGASALVLLCAAAVLACAFIPVLTVAGTAALLCIVVAVTERGRMRSTSTFRRATDA